MKKLLLLLLALPLLFAACSKIPDTSISEPLAADELQKICDKDTTFAALYQQIRLADSLLTPERKAYFASLTYRDMAAYRHFLDDTSFINQQTAEFDKSYLSSHPECSHATAAFDSLADMVRRVSSSITFTYVSMGKQFGFIEDWFNVYYQYDYQGTDTIYDLSVDLFPRKSDCSSQGTQADVKLYDFANIPTVCPGRHTFLSTTIVNDKSQPWIDVVSTVHCGDSAYFPKEWLSVNSHRCSDFADRSLGNILAVTSPKLGTQYKKDQKAWYDSEVLSKKDEAFVKCHELLEELSELTH